MKRYGKRILTVLAGILMASAVNVNAKMMSVEELGKAAEEYEKDAGFIFVVGKYAYTSNYKGFNIQDVMLASRSIDGENINPDNVKDLVNTMTIYRIDRDYDDNYQATGWNYGGTEVGNGTAFGDGSAKVDIKYIDYHVIAEDSEASISADFNNENYKTYSDVLKDALGFETSTFYGKDNQVKIENGKAKGLLLRKNVIDIHYNEDDQDKYVNANYFLAYVLEVPGATEKTTITIDGINGTDTIDINDFDVKVGNAENRTPGIVILTAIEKAKWEAKKEITITVDIDGSGSEYGASTYALDLSELEFQEDSTYEPKLNSAHQDDLNTLAGWGYNNQLNRDLQLKDGKLTGILVEQELTSDAAYGNAGRKGYFYYFTLDLPDGVDKDKVKISSLNSEKGEVKKTFKPGEYDANGDLTLFPRIAPDATCTNGDCNLYFSIDLDGEGEKYLPVYYTIDGSGLTLEKSSFSKIESEENGKLKENYGWSAKTDKGYKVEITQDEQDHSKYLVNGLLPIYEDSEFENQEVPFGEGHNKKYYFGVKLTTEETKTDDATIKIQSSYDQDSEINADAEAFDDNNSFGMLIHVHPEDTIRTMTITIDLDGDKEEYAPYTITLDYSGLKLQENTKPIVQLGNQSETDEKVFTDWGYIASSNENLELNPVGDDKNNVKLTGTLKEQQVDKAAFGENNEIGYYFDYSFEIPNGIDKSKVTITRLSSSDLNGEAKKDFDSSGWLNDGKLSILYRFAEDPKCSDNDNCKIYYKIDYDGTENAYLPTLYTIDYSEVIFEKSSIVEALDLGVISNLNDESWRGWTEGQDYETTFEPNGNIVHVKGFIPVFDDSKWTNGNPFPGAYEHYLAFKLKKAEATGTTANQTVKILSDGEGSGETNKITGTDFGNNDEIYVLKYINPAKEGTTKQFMIEVDLDEGKEYAPYTLTIDWSGLEFQTKSVFTDTIIANNTDTSDTENHNGYLSETDKQQLTNWGYNLELENEGLKLEVSGEHYELTGSIKEQTLKEEAGFQTNNGYYIPIKIYGPTLEQLNGSTIGTDSWTVEVKHEDGTPKIVRPTQDDYNNGFVTVLFKLSNTGDKKLTYKIDWDGEGKYFLPYEEIIDYTNLNFEEAHKFTFNGLETDLTLYDGDTITEDMLPKDTPEVSDAYHNFAYWANAEGTNIVGTKITSDTESNITLEPHWNLYSDKFIADVLEDLNKTEDSKSEDFSSEFKIENYVENSGEITITVIDPTTKLSRMNDTSIPGAIAYILLKDEIKEITLSVNGEEKTFTKNGMEDQAALKKTIQDGAKELYAKILKENFDGKTDEDVTLGELANKEGYESFTLKFNPETISKNVTLVKAPTQEGISLASDIEVPTDYKFTFDSDIVVVNSQQTLETALKGLATHIFIDGNFEVSSTIDIDRKVEINGSNHVITAGSGVNPIFTVKSNDVTIENVELKGSQNKAIVVENGSLTTTGVKITHEDAIPESFEAAIEVQSGARLTASKMTFEKEDYEHPLVKTAKTGASVTLTNTQGTTASQITKEKITSGDLDDKKETDTGYDYYNYYNDANNSKIYETVFYTHEAGYRLSYTKYNHYNETIQQPKSSRFTDYTYEGEQYHLIGYSENSWESVIREEQGIPSSVITPENLKATSDKHYWASFQVKEVDGVKKVEDEQSFKDALNNSEVKEIYITKNITITYNETLTIDRDVSIIGYSGSTSSNQPTIKAQKIVINNNANKVFINRVNLTIDAQENQDSLIEVNGEKFTLWQSGLSNISEKNNVDYAIKYTNTTKSIVDVRWMGISSLGFSNEKINNAYIYVEGKMAAGSEIYLNSFKKLANEKDSSVIIKDFASDAAITEEDIEPDIRFALNTCNTHYAIKLLKETSNQSADITLETSTEKLVGIEYDEDHNNFEKIDLYADYTKVVPKYITNNEEKTSEEFTSSGGKGVTFKVKAVLSD